MGKDILKYLASASLVVAVIVFFFLATIAIGWFMIFIGIDFLDSGCLINGLLMDAILIAFYVFWLVVSIIKDKL